MLPIPLTSIFCLYVIRRRPGWLPGVVGRLYAEKEKKPLVSLPLPDHHDAMVTRRRCTISLSCMVLMDFLIPCTILTGLYVTRRRPMWFKNIVSRLYADLPANDERVDGYLSTLDEQSINDESIENKLLALQKSNNDYVLSLAHKKK